MAYIKTLFKKFFNNIEEGEENSQVYPVTVTKAVFDENNVSLTEIIDNIKNDIKNIDTNNTNNIVYNGNPVFDKIESNVVNVDLDVARLGILDDSGNVIDVNDNYNIAYLEYARIQNTHNKYSEICYPAFAYYKTLSNGESQYFIPHKDVFTNELYLKLKISQFQDIDNNIYCKTFAYNNDVYLFGNGLTKLSNLFNSSPVLEIGDTYETTLIPDLGESGNLKMTSNINLLNKLPVLPCVLGETKTFACYDIVNRKYFLPSEGLVNMYIGKESDLKILKYIRHDYSRKPQILLTMKDHEVPGSSCTGLYTVKREDLSLVPIYNF